MHVHVLVIDTYPICSLSGDILHILEGPIITKLAHFQLII